MTSPTGPEVPAILAVDDHASNLLALETVLAPLGYSLVSAASGPEALRRLSEREFVLILMDVHMPGLDGYDTTARVRENEAWRDIPVIFLTAVYDQIEHTRRGYQLGAVDYVSKPYDPEVLRGKVRALVRLYTRGREAERRRSQEAERIKDLFLGAVGHDLRNPLNAVLLASKMMLLADGCSDERHADYARKVTRAGHRMHRMIEDILDLTRKEFAGGILLSRREADLGAICRGVIEEHRLARPDRDVALEERGDLTGHWDSDRLARLASNLLGNALEHQTGPVSLRLEGRREDVVLAVHNGGAPIEPHVLPRLFEPFRRGDTSSNGLGLGLYIVREIARAHLGSVELASTDTDGTTFTVVLPRAT